MQKTLDSLSAYLAELWRYRYFWASLVQLDVRTRYRGSFLGVGWSLLKPIAMTIVICVVFGSLFRIDVKEFAPSLLIGLSFWAFVSESTLGGCVAFHQAEGYIRQLRLPLAMFPLRVVLGAGFHFLVSLALVVVMIAFIRGVPPVSAVPVTAASLLVLLVLGWALACLGGLVQVFFPDMRHILEIFLQLTFYLTPIMYPAELLRSRRGGALLLDLNPFAAIVEQVRQPLLRGGFESLGSYAFVLFFVTGLTALAAAALNRMERRLIFWL